MSELWQPDQQREKDLVQPGLAELTNYWGEHRLAAQPMVLPDGVYGVAEAPETEPTAVISIDLDEIVRMSGQALLSIRGGTIDDMISDGATGYLDYGSHLNGWEHQPGIDPQQMRQLLLSELMQADLVQPANYYQSKAAFIDKWRAQGAYVIANTSTLVGCEYSTIDFLNKYFPSSFQGILLPRNHDGLAVTTKAEYLQAVRDSINQQTDYSTEGVASVAIEDAAHHAKTYDEFGVKTFMPDYPWNTGCRRFGDIEVISSRFGGTVDTFVAVDQYLLPGSA